MKGINLVSHEYDWQAQREERKSQQTGAVQGFDDNAKCVVLFILNAARDFTKEYWKLKTGSLLCWVPHFFQC